MFVYKITFRNQFQNAWAILIYLLIFIVLPIYMVKEFGKDDVGLFIRLAVLLFFLFLIPQIVLHLNYYFKNRGDVLFYDLSQRKITINHNDISHTFLFEDILLVERFKSFPLAEDRMQWFPWDSYNYSVIYLKDGLKFIVTSLLVPNMNLPIESNRIKLRKMFYPITK